MKSFFLSEIVTQDGLAHQGIFFQPKKSTKKAVVWLHGLTGRFYGEVKMMESMAQVCEQKGFGFASFNNRGHDMIASAKRNGTYVTIGAGYEQFEECVLDIDAAIEFMKQKGFSEIVLAGSSTGANKAAYYACTQTNKHLSGIVLLSPISDRLSYHGKTPWYKRLYLRLLIAIGKGDKLMVGYDFFPGTPKRFLSLITPQSAEDIFDYGDSMPLQRFSSIKTPILVLLGQKDELADRPVTEIQAVFDAHAKAKKYSSVVVPGASHGFDGKEERVVNIVSEWVDAL
jgi:alpha-beta hydrolase superfamily lysophospholipase